MSHKCGDKYCSYCGDYCSQCGLPHTTSRRIAALENILLSAECEPVHTPEGLANLLAAIEQARRVT